MNTKMNFHHIGIVCRSIDVEIEEYKLFGYELEGVVFEDPLQCVRGVFMTLGGMRIELLEPLGIDSPINSVIRRKIKIYHQCFECSQFEEALKTLVNNGCVVAKEPTRTVAFNLRRVVFLMTPNNALVELLETST